jgi:hypothetical protein
MRAVESEKLGIWEENEFDFCWRFGMIGAFKLWLCCYLTPFFKCRGRALAFGLSVGGYL